MQGMGSFAPFLRAIGVLGCAVVASGATTSPEQSEFFESRIRPLFVSKCHSCHTESKLGGLRLDTAANLLVGGKSGPVLIPGKPAESILIQRIKEKDPGRRMPMGGTLSAAEIQDLEKWIAMGAPWPPAALK